MAVYKDKAITTQSVYGTATIPTTGHTDIFALYANAVYGVAKRTAGKVSSTKLRLYRKGSSLKAKITGFARRKLLTTTRVKDFVSGGEDVAEVLRHPVLDMLDRPNPYMSGRQHFRYTQLYSDIAGVFYWWKKPVEGADKEELYLVPPTCKPERNKDGSIKCLKYGDEVIPGEQLLIHATENLWTPYHNSGGQCPVKAVMESLVLQDKIQDTLQAIMENQGNPSGILSPKGEYGLSETEADKWRMRYRNFRRGGSGDVLVLDGDASFTPLTYKPTDLAVLEIMDHVVEEVCQAFGMPVMIYKGVEGGSRAAYQTALEEWADGAITDRLRDMEDFLNEQWLPLFDDMENLFFAYDSPAPHLEELEIQLAIQACGGPFKLVNESRAELGYDPIEGGDELRNAPMAGVSVDDQPEEAAAPEQTPDAAPLDTEQDIQTSPALTLNGAQIASASAIVQQVATGLLPRDSGLGQLQILLNLTEAQATTIMGSVGLTFFAPKPDAPAASPPASEDEPPEDGEEEAKAFRRRKPQPTPDGKKLVPILQKFFAMQRRYVLGRIEKNLDAIITKGLPEKFVPVGSWEEDLADEVMPVVELYISDSGKSLLSRVGASPDVFNVFNENVAKKARSAALNLSKSTLATTTKAINDALDQTREALASGLEAGESVREMADRINDIFENAESERAFLIAQTEASIAHHEGLRESAKASGVVEGFEWLSSSDPCPECQELNGKRFGIDGDMPPLHPNCMCAVLEITEANDDEPEEE